IVRNPERTRRAERDAPWVDEVRVKNGSNPGLIGYEIRHRVEACGLCSTDRSCRRANERTDRGREDSGEDGSGDSLHGGERVHGTSSSQMPHKPAASSLHCWHAPLLSRVRKIEKAHPPIRPKMSRPRVGSCRWAEPVEIPW